MTAAVELLHFATYQATKGCAGQRTAELQQPCAEPGLCLHGTNIETWVRLQPLAGYAFATVNPKPQTLNPKQRCWPRSCTTKAGSASITPATRLHDQTSACHVAALELSGAMTGAPSESSHAKGQRLIRLQEEGPKPPGHPHGSGHAGILRHSTSHKASCSMTNIV